MKDFNKINGFTDKEWEELASILSGEKAKESDVFSKFAAEDTYNTVKQWEELEKMNNEKEINVDKAWKNVHERINEEIVSTEKYSGEKRITRYSFIKIAAAAIILLGFGASLLYLSNSNIIGGKMTFATNDVEKNIHVTLPDGSIVTLNTNTTISYRANFAKFGRNVKLSGEAFFEITKDASLPFIIDAGKASVKVLGTSFNVITNNESSAVEVFVQTGKVMLSDNSGSNNLVLDPGYIGVVDANISEKSFNNNKNYLSRYTDILVYDGQTLEDVFKDLKRVYEMNIIADDPEILKKVWTSRIENQKQETIIGIICASFKLEYNKEGSAYHLRKKN